MATKVECATKIAYLRQKIQEVQVKQNKEFDLVYKEI